MRYATGITKSEYKKEITERSARGHYEGLNWNKTAQVLMLAPLDYDPNGETSAYFGGYVAIPNPDKTSIWAVMPNERAYFVDDVMMGNPEYSSPTETNFQKYLQHIARANTSVSQFMDFLSKLKVSEEKKQEILGYRKFVTATVTPWNYDHCHYPSEADKKTVEQMLSGD